jgi:hypothetical protein
MSYSEMHLLLRECHIHRHAHMFPLEAHEMMVQGVFCSEEAGFRSWLCLSLYVVSRPSYALSPT